MTKESLVKLLQEDLYNEVKHMNFYLRAATEVEGLHREELREFFLKEAHEELDHVSQFSTLISYLGGIVDHNAQIFWTFGHNPYSILQEAIRMEQQVATNYAFRLQQTEAPAYDIGSFTPKLYDPAIATAHVFYEDQIKNSQYTAWELTKWTTKFPIGRVQADIQ